MILYLLGSLVFALLVAVFAVQNAVPITVTFFTRQVQTSLVIVILAAAGAGALATGLIATVQILRLRLRLRSMSGRLRRTEEELAARSHETPAGAEPATEPPGRREIPGGAEEGRK